MATMYNISGYDPGAYLTGLKNIALQKYNEQMGASGAGADISAPTASQASNIARALARNYAYNPKSNLQIMYHGTSPENLAKIQQYNIPDGGFKGDMPS